MSRLIYLVRHGLSENSGTLLGQSDPPLIAAGMAQAQALAARFQNCGAERLISSPLRRSLETAGYIAASLRLPVEVEAQLAEITYGEWDGRYWEEIQKTDPDAAGRKLTDWNGFTPPGGESWGVFLARVEAAWESLRAAPARVTIVVAHRGVNAVLAAAASGRHWEELAGFEQDCGSACKLITP